MAAFLLLPPSTWPLLYLSGLAWIVALVVSAKLQSILVHVTAMTLRDLPEAVQEYKDFGKRECQGFPWGSGFLGGV